MKSWQLVKQGNLSTAFKLNEIDKPTPNADELLIKVEAFGLNYADVLAASGLYPDTPKLPCTIGYDVCGTIEAKGKNVKGFEIGDRVSALTKFGAYAEYACTLPIGASKIKEETKAEVALAFATQYSTAIYAANYLANLQEGETVLIHAAAGGVGTALCQIAKHKNCVIYGTAGSDEKLAYLKEQGVHYPINYRKENWFEKIKNDNKERVLDVIFDPVGGKYFVQGFKSLRSGGRLVVFGASAFSNTKNIFQKLKLFYDCGFFNPLKMINGSKSIMGVNMLRLANNNHKMVEKLRDDIVKGFYEEKIYNPTVAKTFDYQQLPEAISFLASRKSIGKVSVFW